MNPSTAYTYKVRAKSDLGTSDWSIQGTKTTLPNAPSTPTNIVLASTNSTTTTSWNTVADATSYDIMLDSQLVLGIADTNYTATGLVPGSSHTYKVRARNAGGKSAWSDIQTISTLAMDPNVPINLKSTIETNCITIDWDQVLGADDYEVEIISGDGTSEITTTSAITIVDNNVTQDSTKVYRVRSISQGNPSDWSQAITVSFSINNFGVPENLVGVTSGSAIVLNWDSANGATGYELQIDGQTISTGTNTSYTVSGLEPETNHTFRVRTQNEGGAGEWSSTVSVMTLPAAPQIPSGFSAKATENRITLIWNPEIDATSYDIEIDGSSVIQNVIGTTYINDILTSNTQHTYRIRTVNEDGVSAWSNLLNIATLSNIPNIPENITAVASNNKVVLTWKEDSIADSYEVDIDGAKTEITAATQFIHTGLNANEVHIYKIRSKNGEEYSEWSEPQTISTLPNKPVTPDGIVVTTTGGAITVKYNSVIDATGYDIQIDGETIENGNLVEFTMNMLPGTQHTIRVRAKNVLGTSDWSSESTILIPEETPGIPTGITINSNDNSILLSWDALEGASSYDIEADGIVISVGTNTGYIDAGLLHGTSHSYRIRANNEGGSGLWSSIITKNTILPIPQNLVANTTSGAIQLSWDEVEGSTAYELEIDGVVKLVTGTTYTQDNALPNQEHTYRVRAIQSKVTSEWSTSITAQLPMQVFSGEFIEGDQIEFEVGVNNVKDVNNVKFTIIYDPDQVELVDLYSNTQDIDLSLGDIKGANIKILQLEPGKIVLMVNDDELNGEYSGIIDTIAFKSKASGLVSITYSMNEFEVYDYTSSNLQGLSLNANGTALALNSSFAATVCNYTTKNVPNDISSVNVIPTAQDSTATITVNGTVVVSGQPTTVKLDVGCNTINVVVTAADGTITKKYTITVVREANVYLSSVLIKSGKAIVNTTTAFVKTTYNYTGSCAKCAVLTIIATAEDPNNVSVLVNGKSASSGVALAVPVTCGQENEINIVVKSNITEETETYTYKISVPN